MRDEALILEAVLRLFGIPVSDDDARALVATLIADGGDLALAAAATITRGLDQELYTVALPAEQRTAILAMLEDPPEGLAELRGVLAIDHAQRDSPSSVAGFGCASPVRPGPPATERTGPWATTRATARETR